MNGYHLKLVVFGIVLVALLGYLVSSLLTELSTPAERIRHVIEDAIDDFNDRDLDVADLLASDYQGADGIGRDEVIGGLRSLLWFRGETFRAELREEQLKIDVEGEARAQVTVGLVIWMEGKDDMPWWDLHAVLDLEKRRGDWLVFASRDVNHHQRGR